MTTPSYQRWTTLEFLEFCHPDIRRFHAYWDAKREGRRLPSRADIDPAEMIPFLPNLILVDVESREPLSLTYRLVGTREVEARGRDPTHLPVAEGFYCYSRDEALLSYRLVVESRAPMFCDDTKASPHCRLTEHGSLFLPLSDDGETVNKVMVYTVYRAS
jgi:hypothetical protein